MLFRLDNGLTVVLHENRAAPVVALQAWVQVGSADETPEEAGLAHLHEHMLFKGTARRGPGEIARDVESRGGEINAWTSFDQTVYHLTIASAFAEEGLDILSDALLHSSFDPGELSREIEVVLEEIKRANDMPQRMVSREVFELTYQAHTYGRPVIGYPETVRSFGRDDVLSFYRRHYTPDNITLVVAGDFDERAVREQIRRLWGKAKGTHGGRPSRRREDEPRGMKAKVRTEPIHEAHLALAWPIPDIHSEDLPAIDLLSVVLGYGDSARLVQEVMRDRALCNHVYATAYTPKDPGVFLVGASLHHEKAGETMRESLGQVHRLLAEGPTEEELEVARHLVESEAVWQKETVQGTARKLGFYQTVTGSLDFEARYYERIRSTTAEDLRRVGSRYLRPERLRAVLLGSEAIDHREDALHRWAEEAATPRKGAARAPSPPAARPSPPSPKRERLPAVEDVGGGILRARLESGATILLKREPAVPVVAIRASFLGGLREEDDATSGIGRLVARSLTKGTRHRSAKEIASATDALGTSISGNAGRNSIGLRGDCLSRNFDESLRLFAECLREPAFEEGEVEREKALQLEEIRTREDNPAGVAFDLFSRALYGSHPYHLDILGQRETVSSFGPQELHGWHRRSTPMAGLFLSVVGDLETDHALALAAEHFGGDGGPASGGVRRMEVPPLAAPVRVEREMEKEQAHLVFGFSGASFYDPWRHALEVLASVLAGQGGRLFVELRDKRSLAYSVTAFSLEGTDPGHFAVYMGTSPEKLREAEEGIRAELEKVVQEPITEEELLRAQRYLVGSHSIGLQRNAARAASISLNEAYGLGAASDLHYRERIESVGREDVLQAARKVIDFEKSVLAVVRPKSP